MPTYGNESGIDRAECFPLIEPLSKHPQKACLEIGNIDRDVAQICAGLQQPVRLRERTSSAIVQGAPATYCEWQLLGRSAHSRGLAMQDRQGVTGSMTASR